MAETPTVQPLGLPEDEVPRRKAVFDALAAHNVVSVNVDYSGSGDEGYINNIEYIGANGKVMKIGNPIITWTDDGEDDQQQEHLNQLVEDFCWDDIVASEWDGFWNDDGGYGDMVLNVATRTITWNHTEYVTSTQDYSYAG